MAEYDEPESGSPTCRHLLVCRNIWYSGNPDDGFSLGHVIVHLRPEAGMGFPVRFDRLFVFAQVFGLPGEYPYRIRLVRIGMTDYGEEVELQIGPGGQPRDFIPKRPLVVSGEDFVDAIAVPLVGVAIREPGVYEFQLWVDGRDDEPLARERVEARE